MKNLRTVLAALALTALAATPALAEIKVSGDAYLGYYDKYLWRGIDLSGGTPVVQGGVNLSTGGFTLGYWTNIQTKDDVVLGNEVSGGDATETDITIDYTFSPIDKLSVSVGNIWYALDGADDTKEAYLGLALEVPLAPTVTVYYDYDQAEEDGLFYTLALGHSFAASEKLSVDLSALVSYNGRSDYAVGDYSAWHNYELGLSATYALTEQLSLTPSLLYSAPISDQAKDAIDSEWLAGLSIGLSF